jgi:hypothetical protein
MDQESGMSFYHLHGINPIRNPGVYEFKSRLAGAHGCDVHLLGDFGTHILVCPQKC